MTTLVTSRIAFRLKRTVVVCQIALLMGSIAWLSGCSSAKTQQSKDAAEAGDDESAASSQVGQNDTADSELNKVDDEAANKSGNSDKIAPQLLDDELGDASAQGKPDLAISEPKPAPVAPMPQEKPAMATEVSLTDIRYVARKGGGTVVVETSAPATYHTREVPGQSQVILEIANAQLPDRLKHPYVTKDFNQSINSVNAYQDQGSSTVRVVVQFRSPMHADVRQEGMKLELAPSEAMAEIEDNPTLGGDQPSQTSASAAGAAAAAAANSENGVAPVEGSQTKPGETQPIQLADQDPRILPAKSVEAMDYDNIRYYGRPISIEVRDTPVRDVINIIADHSGANIVMGSDVEGNISLKLRQIPWDQALLIIMKTKNLGYVRQGSILRVEPYASLQRETTQARLVVEAQKLAEPLRVKILPLGYARAVDLEKQLANFLTQGRGKAVPDARTNSLVITDIPEVIDRVSNLIKALDIAPLQVLIEGKVVEATQQFRRDLGINWGYGGSNTINLGQQQLNQSLSSNLSVPSTAGQFQFSIGQFNLFGTINATLGLAEAENLAHVISSPRVVAINNEQATIVQGQNVPVATVQPQVPGIAPITSYVYTAIEMKLEVTPQVTSQNDVIMLINIKRDFVSATPPTGQPPAIDHRQASTRVLVRNGQTAVVGGVYQNDTTENEAGYPWLRSIPVLGWLFKTQTTTKLKSELLVFLTPRILNAETALQKESSL